MAAFNALDSSLAQPLTIEVARAPLTITANDKQITAGDPLPAFDTTVTGLVAGDTPTGALTTPPSCSAAGATATPAPGIYPINAAAPRRPTTRSATSPAP